MFSFIDKTLLVKSAFDFGYSAEIEESAQRIVYFNPIKKTTFTALPGVDGKIHCSVDDKNTVVDDWKGAWDFLKNLSLGVQV